MTTPILVVAREFTEGGAAYLAARHLGRLAAAGRQSDLLVTGPVSPRMAAELPAGVRLSRLDLGSMEDHAGLLAIRGAITAAEHPFLGRDYDAVIGTSLFPEAVPCTAFRVARGRRKLLVLLDEALGLPDPPPDLEAAMRSAVLAADHLLPVSQGLLDTLARRWPELLEIPATVIPPPIDPPAAERPSPFPADPAARLPRVVTVARLYQDKQQHRCLQAHRRLRDAGIEFHWHVVGEGPHRPLLEREIAALGMHDRFHLEGFQDDPRAWMRHADLFVLWSRTEGCPTVIREALAEGTPVLSSEVNGARELVSDGVTGIVVPGTDAALDDALRRLLAEPAFRTRLRANLARAGAAAGGAGDTDRLAACLAVPARPRSAPVVTILIPAYNHAAFIGRAIQSGLMQDFEPLEVVVCDDASTDGTERIARRWSHDHRFRYERRPVNLGRVANYRRAVEADAQGEWVVMLDGDDHLTDPSFITKAMRALGEHAAAQPLFVQAGHRVVRQTAAGLPDDTFPHIDVLPEIARESAVMTGGDYLAFVYETGFFTHLGTLYSRAAALRQGFYTSDISSADMDSLLRLALIGNVVVMKSIAGAWVQHGGNTSSNLPLERIEENVRIFRRIARKGAAAGVVDMARLEDRLTRYEARTLAHLFGTAVGKSALGPLHALRMMGIMIRVNPRVCLEPELAAAWRRYAKRLTKMSLKRLEARIKRAAAPLRRRAA
jgi:glycosyltransferase involved in cell wall biosynthesis